MLDYDCYYLKPEKERPNVIIQCIVGHGVPMTCGLVKARGSLC